jgi:hypothetical protein
VTDEPIGDLTIGDVLTAAAQDLAGVESTDEAEAFSWSIGSRVFAALTEGRAEFCLDPLVVGAALRTPDTSQSARGPDWVAFAPAELDDAAVDRAEAWFLSAHRRASTPRN